MCVNMFTECSIEHCSRCDNPAVDQSCENCHAIKDPRQRQLCEKCQSGEIEVRKDEEDVALIVDWRCEVCEQEYAQSEDQTTCICECH